MKVNSMGKKKKRFLIVFFLTGKPGIGCMKGTGEQGTEGSICID